VSAEISRLPIKRGEKFFSYVSSSVRALRAEYDRAVESWASVQDQLKNTESNLQESASALLEEKQNVKTLNANLHSSRATTDKVKAEYTKAVQAYRNKKQEADQLTSDIERLSEEKQEINSRYELVCSAISPEINQSERYTQFKTLLNESLLPFINRVNVVANEAHQVTKIRAVEDELRLTDSLSEFSSRTVVAVAGGFSSGKSSLITSLFANDDVSLPIGIEPVTAIPTYVFHADKISIRGYPQGGGIFDVSQHMYSRLSHKFVEEFGFNLRDLLPFMSLEVPMSSLRNIAFIDLPGYNPGDRGGATSGDMVASDEYVTQGQALIWVIGMDANGTIPRDDLEQLWSLANLDMPLYVVLNKADLRPMDTLEEVLEQVSEDLQINGIPFEGICAYSSAAGGELIRQGKGLLEFLTEWDEPRDALKQVADKLFGVIDDYEEALETDIASKKTKASLIKALELNLLEAGAFEVKEGGDFDVDKYMKAPRKSKKKGPKQAKEEVSAASLSFHMRMLMLGQHVDNEDADIIEETEVAEEITPGAETDQVNASDQLINTIRDQLQELRQDFSGKQSETDLAELRAIREELEQLFA
jgi:archaellum component FlaC